MAKNEVVVDLDEDNVAGPVGALAAAADADLDDVVNEDVDEQDKLPKTAKINDDGTVTLPLVYPKTINSRKDGKILQRQFDALTFHRLTGADQRAIGAASDQMSAVVAFSQSTKLNQAVMNALFDKMDMADITNASRVLTYFLTSGPKTGR